MVEKLVKVMDKGVQEIFFGWLHNNPNASEMAQLEWLLNHPEIPDEEKFRLGLAVTGETDKARENAAAYQYIGFTPETFQKVLERDTELIRERHEKSKKSFYFTGIIAFLIGVVFLVLRYPLERSSLYPLAEFAAFVAMATAAFAMTKGMDEKKAAKNAAKEAADYRYAYVGEQVQGYIELLNDRRDVLNQLEKRVIEWTISHK